MESSTKDKAPPALKQPLKDWQEIVARAKVISTGRMRRVAVAAAEDAGVLQAVVEAKAQGICDAVLIGDPGKIRDLAAKLELDLTGLEIGPAADAAEAAAQAAKLAMAHQADVIMKGFLPTSTLLKAVLAKDKGLKRSEVMSHCAVLSLPNYPRLLNITDGGMVVSPDMNQKIEIIKNAITVSHALGIETPCIALMAATDLVNPNMPRAMEDAVISKMAERGQIRGAFLDGPLTLDSATSPEIAQAYYSGSPVAGHADVLIANSIEEGNIISKSLILFGGAVFCGVIVGAAVPISLVSRSDPPRNKLASVAISVVLSEFLAREGEAS
jgi:phosphate butyryltransferase